MDASFGFVGKDFALVAADCSVPRSIVIMKSHEDKIVEIGSQTLFCLTGEVSDRKNFGEYIDRNIKWYEMRNGRKLDNEGIANYTRNELAMALRRNPYHVSLLHVGYDDKAGPCLYYMDYLGSLQKLNTGAQGYCGYFLYSLFDRHWKKDLTIEEGLKLVELCMDQLQKRFLISMKHFIVKIVSKDGIKQINLSKNIEVESKEVKVILNEKEASNLADDEKEKSLINEQNSKNSKSKPNDVSMT